MRRRELYVVPLALVLAATACSGPGENPGSESPDSSPPVVTGTPPGTSATASPSGSVGGSASADSSASPLTGPLPAFTAKEIVDAAREVARNQPGSRVSTEADIAARVSSGEKLLADMGITPAACTAFMDNSESAVLQRADVAAVSISGASIAMEMDITLASYPVAADPARDFAAIADSVRHCGDFSLAISGQEATGSVAPLTADSDAEATLAYSTTIATGVQEATTVTVRGRDGHVVVSGTVSGAEDLDAALEQAVESVDEALAALRTR